MFVAWGRQRRPGRADLLRRRRRSGRRGLRVPEDVFVVGVDDSALAAFAVPALTIGAAAAPAASRSSTPEPWRCARPRGIGQHA